MNAKLSQHMTLLGICAMAFYGVMLGSGKLSIEVLPQFAVSALIFLSSGRFMRRAARIMTNDEDAEKEKEEKAQQQKERLEEPDWQFLTNLMNWTAALMIVGIMAIILMKPIGLTFQDAFSSSNAQENYFAGSVP